MYSVVDSAGQTYGPVPLDTLRQWAAEGRINPATTLIDQAGTRGAAGEMLLAHGVFSAPAPAPFAPPMEVAPQAPSPFTQKAPAPEAPQAPGPVAMPAVSYAYKGSQESGAAPMLATRAVAFFIDYGFAIIVHSLISASFGILFTGISNYGHWSFWGYLDYFSPSLVMLYFLLRDAAFPGQSIGKRIANLRVVTADGAPAGIMHSVLRNIVAVPLLLLPIPYIGAYAALPLTVLLFLADTFAVVTTGRRLGDTIAHTQVVNA